MIIPMPGEYRLTLFGPDQSGKVKIELIDWDNNSFSVECEDRSTGDPSEPFKGAMAQVAEQMYSKFGSIFVAGTPLHQQWRIDVSLETYEQKRPSPAADLALGTVNDMESRYLYRVHERDRDGRIIREWGLTAPLERLGDLIAAMQAHVINPLLSGVEMPDSRFLCLPDTGYPRLEDLRSHLGPNPWIRRAIVVRWVEPDSADVLVNAYSGDLTFTLYSRQVRRERVVEKVAELREPYDIDVVLFHQAFHEDLVDELERQLPDDIAVVPYMTEDKTYKLYIERAKLVS